MTLTELLDSSGKRLRLPFLPALAWVYCSVAVSKQPR